MKWKKKKKNDKCYTRTSHQHGHYRTIQINQASLSFRESRGEPPTSESEEGWFIFLPGLEWRPAECLKAEKVLEGCDKSW